ncbi:MAG: Pr6Pr family membrane protein [Nocardioides sp.]
MHLAWARRWHLLTAVVAVVTIGLQLLLVIRGGQVLDEVEPPGMGLRLMRFVVYFTVQSNILVAITATMLTRDPLRDGVWWRCLRLAAIVGITVTGLVHFVLLRPLLDLGGADWAADKLLHMVVPALAVVGWAAFGPRPRVSRRAVAIAFAWPVAWLAVVLGVGAWTGWYPYPFLDHREEGAGAVVIAAVGVTIVFVALIAGARRLDRSLPAAPRL